MAKEQYILELGMLEQEAMKLQQQMQMIDQPMFELQNLQFGLQELEKSGEKEMLANLGKNIFITLMLNISQVIRLPSKI